MRPRPARPAHRLRREGEARSPLESGRARRVAEIVARVRAGTYEVDVERLADAMLRAGRHTA